MKREFSVSTGDAAAVRAAAAELGIEIDRETDGESAAKRGHTSDCLYRIPLFKAFFLAISWHRVSRSRRKELGRFKSQSRTCGSSSSR